MFIIISLCYIITGLYDFIFGATPVMNMKEIICPHCDDQGVLVYVKTKKTGEKFYICDECDSVWSNLDDFGLNDTFVFKDFAQRIGIEPLWDELIILDEPKYE